MASPQRTSATSEAPRLLVYVSGHGFGHATRQVALLRALRERAPRLALHVRSSAPEWIFTERKLGVTCSAAPLDPGVVQPTGLDVDRAATLAAHEALLAEWEDAVEREARFVRELRPRWIVADVPPLACAAAARTGVPVWAVANFSWDWIFGIWAAEDPRWHRVAERYREAYARAEGVHRLPLHGDLGAFRRVLDTPHLVNRSQRSHAECRAALGVSDPDTRLVLVSFGGFGSGGFEGGAAAELDGYRFVALEPSAPRDLPGVWRVLPRPSPVAHEDLMNACDAVLGKAGYGTVAEALAHGTRFLYLPRPDFPEVPVLEQGLLAHGGARPMPREDFEAGRWRPHLDALFAQPPPSPPPPCDGAARIADFVLDN